MKHEILTNLEKAQNELYQIRLAVCKMPAMATEQYSSDFTVALPDGIQHLNDDRWESDMESLLKGHTVYIRGKHFKLS